MEQNAALLKEEAPAGGVTDAMVVTGLVVCSCDPKASRTIWNNTLIN